MSHRTIEKMRKMSQKIMIPFYESNMKQKITKIVFFGIKLKIEVETSMFGSTESCIFPGKNLVFYSIFSSDKTY